MTYDSIKAYFRKVAENPEEFGAILTQAMTIAPRTCELHVGDRAKLNIIFQPENVTNPNVVWHSRRPSVATVDPKKGIVTAKKTGYASLFATALDGSGVVASSLVIVK